ncbi:MULTISPECIES: hypothetical protein [Frankia]|uniref:hypothetical protein n=1 Tax=Frankia TaxID=1854 RepID=UPI0005D0F890|nr:MULTISPECIES: hypothetical protein [Frankia]
MISGGLSQTTTVLRRRALGESVEQIQPDLIISTGKRSRTPAPGRPNGSPTSAPTPTSTLQPASGAP